MISKEIQEFIGQMKKLNSVGCILVADKSLQKLLRSLDESKEKIALPHLVVTRKTQLEGIKRPSILVISEKEYASENSFTESIREKADYFINIA